MIVYLLRISVNENTQKRGGARSAEKINLSEKSTYKDLVQKQLLKGSCELTEARSQVGDLGAQVV